MKILHTSDWHLGKSLESINRIEEQREFIDHLCHIAEDESIDLVLIAGDVFDTYNPSAAAEELFYDAIDRLNENGRRTVVIIAGNHDNPERLCAASPLARKKGIILLGYPKSIAEITGMVIDSGSGWMEIKNEGYPYNTVIVTLPYPSESRLEQVLHGDSDEAGQQKAYSEKIREIITASTSRFRDDTVNVIVSHLFIRGGRESESERTLQLGGALSVDPSVFPSNCHIAALGHLHRPQQIPSEGNNVFYSGSPLAYSFSEAQHTKAVYIVEAVPGEKADIRARYLDCGKPLRKWYAEAGVEQAIEWCLEKRDENAWIDLEIETDRIITPEEQKKLRSLNPGIINIRPKLRTEAAKSEIPKSREGRKIDELFRDYHRYRTGCDIADELMDAFLAIVNEVEEERI